MRWRRAIAKGKFCEAAMVLTPDATHLREGLFTLQYTLIDSDPPDFSVVKSVCDQHPGTPLPSAVVGFYLESGHVMRALDVAMTFVDGPQDAEAFALLAVLDALLLRRA